MPDYDQNRMIILGLMSGTSLDGLDLALCEFWRLDGVLKYKLIHAETIPYSSDFKKKIEGAFEESGSYLAQLNTDLGIYFGTQSKEFLNRLNIRADYISSHGQTIFHRPENRMTLQIGSPAHIAAIAQHPVIADFRSGDVARGGQGAPLVPVGDELLFHEYDACLNLGGFANVSMNRDGKRIAFDICVCNMLLNEIASLKGLEYDENGQMATMGKIDSPILGKWNQEVLNSLDAGKSLGREDFERIYRQDLKQENSKPEDLMATASLHISTILGVILEKYSVRNVLITGGGALNGALISELKKNTRAIIELPGKEMIFYKEAIIFALLGYLRVNHQTNVWSSVTGASEDHIAGGLWYS